MSGFVTDSVKCGNCGFVFQADDLSKPLSERSPCPNCGSLKRVMDVNIEDKLVLHEYLKVEAKKPSSAHKKHRADYEFEQGVAKGRNGNLVYKRKVKDRENSDSPGSYVEYVRDKDGNIIVNKSEKLSEHRKA
jgi:predicted  nucleic acid-binding Zn-ribbon protein